MNFSIPYKLVLGGASLLCRQSIGLDVAPDAIIVANAKVDPPSKRAVQSMLKSLPVCSSKNGHAPWQIRTFFSSKTLRQLLDIRDHLLQAAADGKESRKRAATSSLVPYSEFFMVTRASVFRCRAPTRLRWLRIMLGIMRAKPALSVPPEMSESAWKFGLSTA